MGSFSWLNADTTSNNVNIYAGMAFCLLIPKEFGGGEIFDSEYQDYGYLDQKEDGTPKYDMYELLACWNAPDLVKYDGKFNPLKEIDQYTEHNRNIGIDMGCYDEEIDKLKFPLKLVQKDFCGTYESLATYSYGDPDQGFYPVYRYEEEYEEDCE